MRSEEEIRERIKNLENGTQLMREDSLFAEYIYFNKILIAVLEWVLEDTENEKV